MIGICVSLYRFSWSLTYWKVSTGSLSEREGVMYIIREARKVDELDGVESLTKVHVLPEP